MKHTIVFLVLVLLLTMTGCKKLPDPELEKLFGTWDWIQTSGGFGGGAYTPASAGYNQTIEFKKSRICKLYKDGELQLKRRFKLKEGESIYSSETAYIIEYRKNWEESIEFWGHDTLVLKDECYDCYMSVYVRK